VYQGLPLSCTLRHGVRRNVAEDYREVRYQKEMFDYLPLLEIRRYQFTTAISDVTVILSESDTIIFTVSWFTICIRVSARVFVYIYAVRTMQAAIEHSACCRKVVSYFVTLRHTILP